MLKEHTLASGETAGPDRYVRASDFNGKLGRRTIRMEDQRIRSGRQGKVAEQFHRLPLGPGRPRRSGTSGIWRQRKRATAMTGCSCRCWKATRRASRRRRLDFPYFGGIRTEHFPHQPGDDVSVRKVPVRRITLAKDGEARRPRRHGVRSAARQLRRRSRYRRRTGRAKLRRQCPYTPAAGGDHQRADAQVITMARQFADNADKTHGKSMVIIGAAMNHWYHCDMNYRGIINMLMMCGCIGQSGGGGWAHYVGQGKLRPQTGWTALAFCARLDPSAAAAEQHQLLLLPYRSVALRKAGMEEVLSPLAEKPKFGGSMIDYNVRAERMGWLPSAPQFRPIPCRSFAMPPLPAPTRRSGQTQALKGGRLKMSCEDRMHRRTGRATCSSGARTCLGSSGKGHECFLKHLLGTSNGVQAGSGPRRSQTGGSGLA